MVKTSVKFYCVQLVGPLDAVQLSCSYSSSRSGILGWQSDIAMSVTSIPTNDVHNNSFTDVSTTMLWPSSEYTLTKSLRLRSK